jgi:flagellar basal-body rod modification protein FlgD
MVTATSSTSTSADIYAALNAANSSVGKSAGSSASSASSTQDRFLTLLVTQMKNQDPLNPMDNAQVTSQMAQLSTVTGIDKLNTTMQAMSASQALTASGMIGHGVLVAGSSLSLSGGQALGGVELTKPADSLKITIKDSAGKTVDTIDMGKQGAGVVPFVWDGKLTDGTTAPDGDYTFSVSASQAGSTVTANALAYGVVNSITPTTSGVTLGAGALGDVSINGVKKIL